MEEIKRRILILLTEKGLNVSKASGVLDIPQRTLNRQLNEGGSVSMELIRAINRYFPEVSIEWILSGKGEMYNGNNESDSLPKNVSPYYNSVTVSAGVRDTINDCEAADGFVSIPGANADFYFPVVGTSMQPEINEGDIIGVKKMESFIELDAKRVYMIVTHDSRFIKHCSTDPQDDGTIVCTSPNYHPFRLKKDEILAIYDVVIKISNV